jgi:tol-pal system protein YbgF
MLTANRFRIAFLLAALVSPIVGSAPVRAESTKDKVDALTDKVSELMAAVQRLQSTVDSKVGVLQHLVEQTADNANRVTASMDELQKKINAQSETTNGKLDSTSGQIQSLNDSVDELKSRMTKLDKTIQDLQGQMQNVQNPPTGMPGQPGGGASPAVTPGMGATQGAPAGGQAPPLQETYQAALRDYNTARYDVAAGEFKDVLTYYPQDDLAGNAQFYLGEISYKQGDYAGAVKAYNAVLEGFSGSSKAPAAQLHKGQALIKSGKRDAGIRELRALVQRHPQTPEATQARAILNGMGVKIAAPPKPQPQ